jgi:hypothetical protein
MSTGYARKEILGSKQDFQKLFYKAKGYSID